MKILKTNQDGFGYFLNMTLLVLTYFVVRILPLPFVLHLFASKSKSITCGESINESIGCIIEAFFTIPIKCQAGCLVMYALQIYWFYNILRSWLRIALKKPMLNKLKRKNDKKEHSNNYIEDNSCCEAKLKNI